MFDLRAVIDDTDLPPFLFTDAAGGQRQLPHLQALTTRQALRAMDGDLEGVLRQVAPEVADVVLDLPAYALDALLRAWMAHSGVDEQGKSASPSSGSTATPSKRTSRSTGSRSRR